MSAFIPGAPQPGEYPPAFAGYIGKVQSFADPVEKLNLQLDEILQYLRSLAPAKRLYRYAAGKWSVQEVLGHVTDAERIFSYRALRIGRADGTPLPGFEENDYVAAAEAERCDWNELLAEFEAVRHASVHLYRHLPERAWIRRGIVNGASVSVRALAYITIGHAAHHLDVLRERYL
jgi:uncharacterized damage-inducible protein DinB